MLHRTGKDSDEKAAKFLDILIDEFYMEILSIPHYIYMFVCVCVCIRPGVIAIAIVLVTTAFSQ